VDSPRSKHEQNCGFYLAMAPGFIECEQHKGRTVKYHTRRAYMFKYMAWHAFMFPFQFPPRLQPLHMSFWGRVEREGGNESDVFL
jgi:hypothetical protein